MAIPPGGGQNQRQILDALKEDIKRDLNPVVDMAVEEVAAVALEGSKQSVKASATSSLVANHSIQRSVQSEYTPQSVIPVLTALDKSTKLAEDRLLDESDRLDKVDLGPVIDNMKPHARSLKDQAVDTSFKVLFGPEDPAAHND